MRELKNSTLTAAGQYYASLFMANAGLRDRDWVMKEFFKFRYKDEFDILVDVMSDEMGGQSGAAFGTAIQKLRKENPRSQKQFEKELSDWLAITPAGDHIEGKIGKVVVGGRPIGRHMIEVETLGSIRHRRTMRRLGLETGPRLTYMRDAALNWPIYAGEGAERAVNSGVATPLPPGTPPLPVGALNTRISNECAILACDAVVDNLDEGSLGAIIVGYTTAQATDPDTAIGAQVKCFTMTCTAPNAFGAAADDTGKATANAATITDDTSADDTQTLAWCRASSSSVSDTALDDHIDGEAGTSGADWTFNTLAIVAGATVSCSAWAVSMPES